MNASAVPSPPRLRARLVKVLVGVGVLIGLAVNPGVMIFIPLVFIVVVPLEKLFPRHRQPLRRPGLGTDLAWVVIHPVLAPLAVVVGITVGVLSIAWLPGLLIRHPVAMLPPVPRAVVGFLLFDMAGYWVHRSSHEVPLLWRFHSIHHSSERMDWASGARSHPLDGASVAIPIAFLVGAGFSFRTSIIIGALKLVTGLLLHANVRFQWRPVQRLIISPEFHHWHHSSERDAINRNYATFLPLWDVLFGTYFMPRDRHPAVYGARPRVPEGVAAQFAHPFRRPSPTPAAPRAPLRPAAS